MVENVATRVFFVCLFLKTELLRRLLFLTELQTRQTRLADTWEPPAWRCWRQETPWFPPRPRKSSPHASICTLALTSGENSRDYFKPKPPPQHSGSQERLAPFPDLLIPRSEAGLSPYPRLPPPAGVHSWTAAHRPGNTDEVTRMKHSWLSAGLHCGSLSLRLTRARMKADITEPTRQNCGHD